jgi:hypothetical protein
MSHINDVVVELRAATPHCPAGSSQSCNSDVGADCMSWGNIMCQRACTARLHTFKISCICPRRAAVKTVK